ncbi:hypothetical protein DYQ86_09225 [Acidobacteria bacterium AB60]|nr:hypothetical protein DYQ86_09225 [Acidobacteria bacterium AB60]
MMLRILSRIAVPALFLSVSSIAADAWQAGPPPAGTAATSVAASIAPGLTLPITTRGQTVTLFGTFPNEPVKVNLSSGKAGEKPIPLDASRSDDGKSINFKVPLNGPVGDFLVFAEVGPQELPVPGELRIQADEIAKVTLDSISPPTDYLSSGSDGFDFVMAGQNLAHAAADNVVIRVGYGPLDAGSPAECADLAAMKKAKKICLSYDAGSEGQRLNVYNYHPQRYEGPVSFAVRVGNNTSNSQKITFSGLRAETLRFLAIVVFLGLAGLVFAVVRRGIRANRLAGEHYGPLSAFFLDRQTNSFSLSKFQVIAWTVVAVFGFVYLFLCRTFVQWNFTFPPIPEGLPTLLGVSAGTTVVATGITAQHGSKGAGPLHPSFADFISSGGIIAGDRFQFFVWTLIGCLGFLALILSQDPATLTQLPDVNGTFLTLMGISSAGYLAGKLVRDPGPIIQLLTITAVDPDLGLMKLEIKGQNLSEEAVVKVDKDELAPTKFKIVGKDKQDGSSNSSFFSKVEVTLLDAAKYFTGPHLIYLVNDDGQSATEAFPVDPVSLDAIPPVKAGLDPVTLHVLGRNFCSGFKGIWVDANGQEHTIPDADIKFVDENHLEVTLVPGAAGTGKLKLVTPARLLGIAEVKVG